MLFSTLRAATVAAVKARTTLEHRFTTFASRQEVMHNFMSGVPLLENGGSGRQGVPEFPYQCKLCAKYFRHLSQLLQHQDQKHGNSRLLTNY
jgi:hypothetical protein